MSPVIVWFRRDLRLHDNPALNWAAAQGAEILPVYLHSPDEEAPWEAGGASRWWLHKSLLGLKVALARQGLILQCFEGNAQELMPMLARRLGARALAVNRLYEPHLAQRDQRVFKSLTDLGVEVQSFNSSLLFKPGSILNGQQQPYRVFTPFWNNVRRTLELAPPGPAAAFPKSSPPAFLEVIDEAVEVASLGLLGSHPWHEQLESHWKPGEKGAQERLDDFCRSKLDHYGQAREFPAKKGSSRLSPHLRFGEISPAQVWRRLLRGQQEPAAGDASSREIFLRELGWREFAGHVIWHFPQTSHQSMNPRLPDTFWGRDDSALKAWQSGQTGVPLIDAGMRELWATGWMHNRVRMLVGSFLTKNLGIHWREGARWFWETLVDADLASNTLGWQWVAGCGVAAAPYYRIFNPETQAQKFDPQGEYEKRWTDGAAPIKPIVDLATSRSQALARYAGL
jgi:deoxyribodipyrimidine photo-lyase